MAKALKTAAIVVGAVALVATGIGAVAVAAGAATVLGVAATTIATIGTLAGAAAAVLSFAASAAAGKPPAGSVGGNATKFKIDKEAGTPYAMGRTYVGGNVVHRAFYGAKNVYESWVTALSLGPVKSIGPLLIDKAAVAFAAGAAIGSFGGYMWLDEQLGACPEVRALAGPSGGIPNWDASSKLSGIAADLWTLKWDKEGKVYPAGVPSRGRVLEGVYVYDPRLDSTYPGGSGACRLEQEATYVWSENPALHAVTWAFGRYQNGVLVAGGGLPVTGIDMQPFVEWANCCDANGWKVGGIVYTNSDDSWDILKMIAQAGGGEVMPVNALLSCTFSAPRVSIGTITSADISGDLDVPATASMRTRRNTIIPRVRLESQGWEVVPLDPVSVPDYVTLDGAVRPKEIDYPLVQDADQGAQLALYQMLNDRELDGIVVPAKIYALGYRPGDCLTLEIPEANLIDRDVVVRQRELDPGTMGVALTCRTETEGKHTYALTQTGTPPRTPDLSNPGVDLSAPSAGDWTAQGTALAASGNASPALIVTGAVDQRVVDAVVFDYRAYIAGVAADVNWTGASFEPASVTRKEITSVTSDTAYEVGVRYRTRGALSDRLILGPVSTGNTEIDWGSGVTGPGKPADNADVTADELPMAWEAWTGRSGPDVVSDLASATDSIALEVMRGATWRGESDQVLYTADGRPVRVVVDAIGSDVDGLKQFVAFLQEVDASAGTSKFLFSAKADGSIVGIEGIAGGGFDQLSFVAGKFLFVDSSGQNPVQVLSYENGSWVFNADITARKITYESLVPRFGGAYSQLSADGTYQVLPSGLIMQRGKLRASINRETQVSVIFPQPFPTMVTACGSTPFVHTFSNLKDLWTMNVGEPTLQGATFGTQSSTNHNQSIDGLDWWAEGY